MGQLMPGSKCTCTCDDDNEKANTITLDPVAASMGDGMIDMGAPPKQVGGYDSRVGSEGFVMSTHEKAGLIKKPEILRFQVSLCKAAGENFGLAHMPMEDGSHSLLIVELRQDGPMARWNKDHKANQVVVRGDRIVAVGAVTDIDGMRELLRQDIVEFTVERWPQAVTIVLKKLQPTDKYGMQTDLIIRDDGSKVLRVGRISGGLLGEWNALAAGSRRFFDVVGQFAEIVKVNDQADDPERMQQMLVTELEVEVTFIRPDPELYNH